MSIRAITFDLWDTLVADDSDEAARARAGLLPKPEARHQAVRAAFQARFPDVTDLDAAAAWQTSLEWFRHEWKVQHRTPDVASRIAVALDHLAGAGVEPTSAAVVSEPAPERQDLILMRHGKRRSVGEASHETLPVRDDRLDPRLLKHGFCYQDAIGTAGLSPR